MQILVVKGTIDKNIHHFNNETDPCMLTRVEL